MAQYKVPQDVEADDKLIGPFSFRQFVYLLIAGGLDFRIIKPNWLREYMKEKLSGILKLL